MTESKGAKISLYVKNKNLREDLGRLALLDGVSLTELVSKALQGYVATRAEDIEFMRHQEQERRDRRSKHDG